MHLDTIHNEDCLLGMQRIPDGSVDMILCDLPYGTTKNKWDAIIPLDVLWVGYKRIVKPNAAVVLTAQVPFSVMVAASNLDWLKYEWIWEKDNATGHLNSKFAPLKTHENILVFSSAAASHVKCRSKAMTYQPQMAQGMPYKTGIRSYGHGGNYDAKWSRPTETVCSGERYPKSIIKFNVDRTPVHPTQKPVALFEYLIRTYTNEGETVLDNCLGSGTTAIACINTGLHYIGFEKDAKYFAAAQARIDEHNKQSASQALLKFTA